MVGQTQPQQGSLAYSASTSDRAPVNQGLPSDSSLVIETDSNGFLTADSFAAFVPPLFDADSFTKLGDPGLYAALERLSSEELASLTFTSHSGDPVEQTGAPAPNPPLPAHPSPQSQLADTQSSSTSAAIPSPSAGIPSSTSTVTSNTLPKPDELELESVAVPTLPEEFIVPIEFMYKLPHELSLDDQTQLLSFMLIEHHLRDILPYICKSQVWCRIEDTLVESIRPAIRGTPLANDNKCNGLYIGDLSAVNLVIEYYKCKDKCCTLPTQSEESAETRHKTFADIHLMRVRPYCLMSLKEVGERRHTADKSVNGTYYGMSEPRAKKLSGYLRNKAIGKELEEVRIWKASQVGVTNEDVAALMARWDVLPDKIAEELGPNYFVFPERFVQMRDVLCALSDRCFPQPKKRGRVVSSAPPPPTFVPSPPAEIVHAVKAALDMWPSFRQAFEEQIYQSQGR
ncbi:unnamed protein product [Peniophora sp. CBMAI 1063]|nr:unnamed protein product [Peniophora sp. CBMAI 1063]